MTRLVDVSVIIPAWRAAGIVERAVASALASTGVRVEVIVVDDGSTDNTYYELMRLASADTRIVIDRLPQNSGPSAARNRAIDLAKGRYIAVLDADDAVAPGRFASLIALAEETEADIVVDNMIEVNEAGQPVGAGRFLKSAAFANPRHIDLATWARFNRPMKSSECIGYLKPMIRRPKLNETGIRYDTSLRNSEDYFLIANLLAEGARMIYTPDAGYFYRRSAASTSHRLQPGHTQAWLAAERRFLARHAGRLPPEAQAALNQRSRALKDVNQFVAIIDAIQQRRPDRALRFLVSDVRASAYSTPMLAKVALGKALRRKLV